jgi:predicted TIM-barrel fold metal-dependent hydrolase
MSDLRCLGDNPTADRAVGSIAEPPVPIQAGASLHLAWYWEKQGRRNMIIVDSQVHIWKAETPDRPWVKGLEPQLPEPLGIEDLRTHMASAGVGRVVIVPPHWEGMRSDYATEAFDRYPEQFRYMGRLNLERPDARAQLPNWMQARGILGMRQSFLAKHEREQMLKGAYDWLWEDAERYGVPLMLHAGDMRTKLEEIATRHPRLTIILDHMGLSTTIAKEARFAEAAANTAALARFPNVYSKLSSAPTHSRETYPFRDMHDYIRRIIDAFGPQRCFWGTDLSHMLHSCSYREGVTLFTEELKLPAETLEWIMGRAICEKLGWPLPK